MLQRRNQHLPKVQLLLVPLCFFALVQSYKKLCKIQHVDGKCVVNRMFVVDAKMVAVNGEE